MEPVNKNDWRNYFNDHAQLFNYNELIKCRANYDNEPGVYAWYFKKVPGKCPTTHCISVKLRRRLWVFHKRYFLLYVGRIGSMGLGKRVIDWHFLGKNVGPSISTLRESLACLLGYSLIKLGDNRYNVCEKDNSRLNNWLTKNARVALIRTHDYKSIESQIISVIDPPLNIKGSTHPFAANLSELRGAARQRANKRYLKK